MIGSNIYITNRFTVGDKITSRISAFKSRVLANGGTFESETCLKNTLTTLNNL